jgi:hypothetical protein
MENNGGATSYNFMPLSTKFEIADVIRTEWLREQTSSNFAEFLIRFSSSCTDSGITVVHQLISTRALVCFRPAYSMLRSRPQM